MYSDWGDDEDLEGCLGYLLLVFVPVGFVYGCILFAKEAYNFFMSAT